MQPGPDFNPYAAPSDHVDRGFGAEQQTGTGPLARLSQRWWGSVVDNLFALLFCIPGALIGFLAGAGEDVVPLLAVGGLVPYFGIQAWLVATSGQSLAKKLLKMKIVTMDGRPPGFVRGVLLRSWLLAAMSFIPIAGSGIGLVDAVLIFRSDRRTLHDHLAGTTVIQVL